MLLKLALNCVIFGVICCSAALVDGFIENKLTEDNNDSKITKYLTWGLAVMGFGIFVDKLVLPFADKIHKDIKELLTGKKYLTKEEQNQEKIQELQNQLIAAKKQIADQEKDITEMKIKIHKDNQEIKNLKKEFKEFKENILKEFDEKIKNIKFEANREVITTKNFIKAHSNFNIENINNFIVSNEANKKNNCNEGSTSKQKQNIPNVH